MRYAPPGCLVDIGACRLHLYQQGVGSPTVVLESGIAGSLLSWSLVQSHIAAFTRVCSYDRAGLGWSDSCRVPRSLEQMVSELATLLERSNVPPPYLFVGHSFGGLLIRAYAHLRPQHVAGLVFIDPVSLSSWAQMTPHNQQRLRLGVRLARRGAWLARLGVVRFALWTLVSGGTGVSRLIARVSASRGVGTLERLTAEVRRLPSEVWPILRAHWSRSQSFEAMGDYLECLPSAAASALLMPLPPNLPFVVLSAANSTEAELLERDGWVRASNAGRHVIVENSAHWIQLEQPVIVLETVRALWNDVATEKSKSFD